MRSASLTRRLVAAGVLAGSVATAALGQITLDAANLRTAAAIALKEGDTARALSYANALIKRDPDDVTALLIRSRALRDQGDTAPARAAARKAWTLADTDEEKYATALITAQVLSTQGKRTRAQLWLRRAVEHAPNERLEAKAKRDFAYVRTRNKWSTTLSFTLAPNSNINNGSARERSELNYAFTQLQFGQPVEFQLSGSAQALSGVEIGAAMRTRYRFKQTRSTAHDLKFGLSYRSFVLSGSAEDQAPDVTGSDFAFGTASIGYGYQQRNLEGKGTFASDIEAGQTWYGGARYTSYLRGAVQQSYQVDASTRHRFGLSAERELGQAAPDIDKFGLSVGATKRFSTGNLGYLALNAVTTQSDSRVSEYGEISLRSGFVLGTPVMGAALQFGLGAAFRDYDVSLHSSDGRQDKRLFADVTATFENVDYYGFNPSVTLSASHTDSNIGLYDTRRFGLSVGIKSAF